MKMHWFFFSALAVAFCGPSTEAAIIYTADFQSPVLLDNGAGFPTGWTLQSGNGGHYNPVNAQYAGATGNGNQFGWVGVTLGGTLRTNASTVGTLAANTIYTLDYILGNRGDFGYPADAFLEIHATTFSGPTLASVNIGTNGTVDPADGTLSGTLQLSFNSASFVPQVGQDLVIVLTTSVTGQANIDDLSLSAVPIPEPSTLALAVLGLLGLGVVALRKKYRRT